jgi:uncharacterized Tic20 family protein
MTQEPVQGYPEQSQATTALVIGIIGVVVCQILGPFAWWMGQKEIEAIDKGNRPPENRGTAQAGKILGIVGTALLGLGILAIIAVVILIAVGVAVSLPWSEFKDFRR